ncbi:MAG: 6-carboxytetrahydropterin synthase, partial [Planctomycetota bacterium]|nr:6-carboxytetrahydropterin synthase [Planctomycetota bacterium]
VFGKCCNPNGHGHNYRLEVEVAIPMEPDAQGHGFNVLDLDAIVHEHIINEFDHTYLNLDVNDFSECNPTVENITLTCHKRLLDPLHRCGVHLRRVRLWETEKTCCAYPAEA